MPLIAFAVLPPRPRFFHLKKGIRPEAAAVVFLVVVAAVALGALAVAVAAAVAPAVVLLAGGRCWDYLLKLSGGVSGQRAKLENVRKEKTETGHTRAAHN